MPDSILQNAVTLSDLKNRYNLSVQSIRYQVKKKKIPMILGPDGKNYLPPESIKVLDKLYRNNIEDPLHKDVVPPEEPPSEPEIPEPKEPHEEIPQPPTPEPEEEVRNQPEPAEEAEILRRETMEAEQELRGKIDALKEEWTGKKVDFEHKFETLNTGQAAVQENIVGLSQQQSESRKAISDITGILKSIEGNLQQSGETSTKKSEELRANLSQAIEEKIAPLSKEIEGIPQATRESVTATLNECLNDPESDACKLIAAMVKPEPPEELSPIEKTGLHHPNADSLLTCEDCGPLIIKSLKEEHPEILERMLCNPEDNECRLQLKLYTEKELEIKVAEALENQEKKTKKSWV